ncbi:hypothetical protein H4R19_002916 [Coemansia spiralis]|nr:hypothetical protein H4R19_002916 [Coemansia spiralis]
MRAALKMVGLPDANLACTQAGAWSMGQRQLLALARVLLSSSPIVVLDEATANIDAITSRRLHAVVREHLAQRTVITIAHQIDAVLGCDKVLVVHDGAVREAGAPADLLAQPSSALAQMAAQAASSLLP